MSTCRAKQFLIRTAIAAALIGPPSAVHAGLNVWTTTGPEGVGVNALATGLHAWDESIDSEALRRRGDWLYIVPIVYAGTAGRGVYRSYDMGASWEAMNTGLEHAYVNSLLTTPMQATTVYAASPNRGVFRSDDAGQVWKSANEGLPEASAHLLAGDPNLGTLYVTSADGLYVSHDGAETWEPTSLRTERIDGMHSLWLRNWIDCLAVDPDGTVYACYFDWSNGSGLSWELVKSSDCGATWQSIAVPGPGGPVAIAIDPSEANTLYVGTYDPLGSRPRVLKSSDGGASWKPFGALHGCDGPCRISGLAIGYETVWRLYVATDNGVYMGATAERTLSPYNTGIAGLRIDAVAIDVAHHGVAYVGASEGAFTIFRQANMCSGDCNGDGLVRVSELVAMVDIALGRQGMATCGAADGHGDGRVAVNEIVAGIASALQGCAG